jgi:hypothetical protein
MVDDYMVLTLLDEDPPTIRAASWEDVGCIHHVFAQPIYNCWAVRAREPEAQVVIPQCAICALLSSRHGDIDCYGSALCSGPIKHLTIFAEM